MTPQKTDGFKEVLDLVDRMEAQNAKLSTENAKLRAEIASLHTEGASVRKDLAGSELEAEALRDEVEQLERKARRSSAETKILKKRNVDLDPFEVPRQRLPQELFDMIVAEALRIDSTVSSSDVQQFLAVGSVVANNVSIPHSLRAAYLPAFLRSNVVDLNTIDDLASYAGRGRAFPKDFPFGDCVHALSLCLEVATMTAYEGDLSLSRIYGKAVSKCRHARELIISLHINSYDSHRGDQDAKEVITRSGCLELFQGVRELEVATVETMILLRGSGLVQNEEGKKKWMTEAVDVIRAALIEIKPRCRFQYAGVEFM